MKTVSNNPMMKRKGIFRLFHMPEVPQTEVNVVAEKEKPDSLLSQRSAFTGNHFAGANAIFDPRFFRKR
jgi:hypothetical protein